MSHSRSANSLDKAGLLGGCFMFKRDIPELRDPRRVLPTLSRSLAQIYAPYRKHVLSVLEKDSDISGKAPKLQLAALFPSNQHAASGIPTSQTPPCSTAHRARRRPCKKRVVAAYVQRLAFRNATTSTIVTYDSTMLCSSAGNLHTGQCAVTEQEVRVVPTQLLQVQI